MSAPTLHRVEIRHDGSPPISSGGGHVLPTVDRRGAYLA